MPGAPSNPPAGGGKPAGGGGFTRKAGPFPIWVWAVMVIGLFWAYEKYKSGQSTASTSSTASQTGAAEPGTGSPYYVIENNIPQSQGTTSTTAPPGKSSSPPTNQGGPVTQGGNPPRGTSGGPISTGGTLATGTPTVGQQTLLLYQVQPGDTWTSVGKKYGIAAAHVQEYNTPQYRTGLPSISTSAALTPGETIVVPWLNK